MKSGLVFLLVAGVLLALVYSGVVDEVFNRLNRDKLQREIREVELAIHEMTNESRIAGGVAALDWRDCLHTLARQHSEVMAKQERLFHSQYPYGENVFCINGFQYIDSQPDEFAKVIVDSWMSSAGHRKNMLNPNYKCEGLGMAISENYTVYATAIFD